MHKIQVNPIHEKVEKLSIKLRLPAFRKHFYQTAQNAALAQTSFEEYLVNLMEIEVEERLVRSRQGRIKRCQLPYNKYISELNKADLPKDAQQKIGSLERLDFIEHGQNLILAGNPGTGKTHIAIGLAIKACLADKSVFFTSVPRLITQIKESRSARMLRALEQRFQNYDLVICDEFGYVSFDKDAAEMLFTHLSLRCGQRSTIITTNLSFNRWNEIFGDEILAAAMVDRLTHKAILLDMNGQSYRLKESKLLQANS